jgi:hypothetical protein
MSPFASLLRHVRDASTGALSWTDDRKRRIAFLDGGELVALQSNLRSEGAERAVELAPGLAGAELERAVAIARVRGWAGASGGGLSWHADAPVPERQTLDLAGLLLACADALPAVPDQAWPRGTPGMGPLLVRLPVSEALRDWLLELDGTRPVDEVLAFGPAEPAALDGALRVASVLGYVETGARGASRASAQAAPASSAAASALSDLFGEVGAAPVASSGHGAVLGAEGVPPSRSPLDGALRGRGPVLAAPGAASPSANASSPRSPLEAADAAKRGGVPSATPPPPVAAPAARASNLSIADLLADTLGTPVATPTPVAAPATAAPAMDDKLGREVARITAAPDHFATLGVSHEATPDAMRRAYFTLARMLHPDQLHDQPEDVRTRATDAFDKVRAAWEVLGDDAAREAYIARVIRGEKSEDELAMERVQAILEAENDFRRGQQALNAGRMPEAHAAFQRVVAVIPDSPEFNAHAAWTSFKLAQNPEAQETAYAALKAAVAANDKLDTSWVLVGMAMRARGNDTGAKSAFIQALKLKPANPDALRELKRLERDPSPAKPAEGTSGGFFGRLFGKK